MNMTPEQRRARIAELERELAELRRHELEEAGPAREILLGECRLLKRAGEPMKAIKHYRSKTGSTLVEARDTVFAL